MWLEVSAAAQAEYDEDRDYYGAIRSILGRRFATTIDRALRQIAKYPVRSPVVYADIRKFVVIEFPYVILYRVSGDAIKVLSIFHTSRDPKTWQSRT